MANIKISFFTKFLYLYFLFNLSKNFFLSKVLNESVVNKFILYLTFVLASIFRDDQLFLLKNKILYTFISYTSLFNSTLQISDSGKGTLYTSDDRGIIYSKSLEDHLYPNGGSHDVYRVRVLYYLLIIPY